MISMFISHSSKDKQIARRLGKDLRSYGAQVWLDEAELRVGDPVFDNIAGQIANTDFVVVLISEHSALSEWVKREVDLALKLRVKILPCRLDRSNLPPQLSALRYADFLHPATYHEGLGELVNAMGLDEVDPEKIFLENYVYFDLVDLNDGFDAQTIRYFTAQDFAIILRRVQLLHIGIYGIEPWHRGFYFDVRVHEQYSADPFDPTWYWKAFNELRRANADLQFSASYVVPKPLLSAFIRSVPKGA